MSTGTIGGASVKLATWFALLGVAPVAALGWLGWRLLDQERALDSQQLMDRLASSATLLAQELDRNLRSWEERLAAGAVGTMTPLPSGSVIVAFDARGVTGHQGLALPYYPAVAPRPEPSKEMFEEAQAEEFLAGGDLSKAASMYRRLSETSDRPLRAAALMRLARCLRKGHDLAGALATYDELAALGGTTVLGSPAELLARRERVAVFAEQGDEGRRAREAGLLASALTGGGFLIDRATFDFYSESLSVAPGLSERVAAAEAAEALWPLWLEQPSGRAGWTAETGERFATIWRRTESGSVAIVGRVEALLDSAQTAAQGLHVAFALDDASGHSVWGTVPLGVAAVTRTSRETSLPWTIHVGASEPAAEQHGFWSRRSLLASGLVLMVLVVSSASYFVFRSVSHELGVAQVQSDFVAAVSHEFRTPLTAMRHLSEVLEEGGATADQLPAYYRALGKETRRLHGLVENLLDFGQMEAGRREYRQEPMNASLVALEAVEAFRECTAASAHRLELEAGPADASVAIRADPNALTLALRNLLDNAVKYSPAGSTVRVSVERQDRFVGIAVQDQGPGMSKQEQRDVFRKFVRGSAARDLNVKGTGLGLTMAERIARAHGGRLEVSSESGRGSRFTIWMPEGA